MQCCRCTLGACRGTSRDALEFLFGQFHRFVRFVVHWFVPFVVGNYIKLSALYTHESAKGYMVIYFTATYANKIRHFVDFRGRERTPAAPQSYFNANLVLWRLRRTRSVRPTCLAFQNKSPWGPVNPSPMSLETIQVFMIQFISFERQRTTNDNINTTSSCRFQS